MFRPFQIPVEPASRSVTPQSKRSTPSRRTLVELPASMTTLPEDLKDGHFTARFQDSKTQAGMAHSSRFIMPPPGTYYLPLKSKEISFSLMTTETVEKYGDKGLHPDHDAFKSPKTLRSYSHPDERPAKRVCTRKGKKLIRTRLTIMRPVKKAEEVVQDAWRMILKQTTPEFLLEARTVCKAWNLLLEEDSIWRQTRIEKYGESAPNPPNGMKERRFADLLAGKGCQNSACPRMNTNKVFWAFRTRLCDDCFKERTIKEDAAGRLFGPLLDQHNLLELLPAGVIRSGKYRGTRQWNSESETWLQSGNKLLYLTSDIKKTYAECSTRIAEGSTDGATDSWRAQKIEEAKELMKQTAQIEEWERQLHLGAPDIRGDRKAFFEEKAMELSPPMQPEVLHKMHAYHAAINSRRPPSEKCWGQLKCKVLGYRLDAERIVRYQEQAESLSNTEIPELELFRALHARRSARGRGRKEYLPEQDYVVRLGRDEFLKLQSRTPPVAYEDLVLLCLRNVYERHIRVPPHESIYLKNGDTFTESYVLTLDDARLIVEEVFEPAFGDDPRLNRVVLEGFRCKGCPRQDCTRKHRFVELFKHIYQKHAQLVGEEYHFDYFALPFPPYGIESPLKFPWYTTNWPRNLPIAASHHEVSSEEVWKPGDALAYVELPRKNDVSAFVDRIARKTDLDYDDFVGNLAHAADKLKNTALEKELQTKIFLRYALDLWGKSSETRLAGFIQSLPLRKPRLSLEQFVDAMTKLRRLNPSLSLRYRCGACVEARGAAKGARFVKNPVDFHALVEHWNKKHLALDWTTNLMDLPDDCVILDQISKADAELEQRQASIRARGKAMNKNPRKKSNAKASVVLGMYIGMEVFNHLFEKTPSISFYDLT